MGNSKSKVKDSTLLLVVDNQRLENSTSSENFTPPTSVNNGTIETTSSSGYDFVGDNLQEEVSGSRFIRKYSETASGNVRVSPEDRISRWPTRNLLPDDVDVQEHDGAIGFDRFTEISVECDYTDHDGLQFIHLLNLGNKGMG